MKKKIIALVVWILITIAYVLNIRDTGRAMASNIEYVSTKAGFMWNSLGEMFQFDFTVVAVTTVIYVVVTVICYHIVFRGKK